MFYLHVHVLRMSTSKFQLFIYSFLYFLLFPRLCTVKTNVLTNPSFYHTLQKIACYNKMDESQ